jgi:signal transduction histidine kinase
MNGSDEEAYLRTAFLEPIAHELRGSVNNVQGAISELEQALGDDAEKHRLLIAMAHRGIARILRTAARLEQVARLKEGTTRFNRAPADLCGLVRYAITSAEGIEARRKVAVTHQMPEAPLTWSLDERWMAVALSELASNAIRHAKQRVIVRVTVSDGEVSVLFAEDNDSGGDLTLDPSKPPRRGMGLGLAIARDVVLLHGGRLDIESGDPAGPARGARVSLTIPREPAAPQETPGREPTAS